MNTIPQPSVFAATRRRLALPVASLFAALALTQSLSAASVTWDANGTTAAQTDGGGAWLTANQWWTGSANTTWVSGSDAVFGNGGTGGAVTLATTATTAQSLTFNSFSGTYTLGTAGIGLTLNGGITMNSGAGAVTILSPVTLGGSQTWANGSGSLLTVSGAVSVTGAFNLTFNGNSTGSMTLSSGTLNNLGTITNSGSGTNATTIGGVIGINVTGVTQNSATSTLILTGANTFTGGLNIQQGTVQVGNAASVGAGTVTIGNTGTSGTLDLNGLTETVIGLATAGTAANQTIGNSSTTANAVLSYTGPTTSTFGGVIKDVLGSGNKTTGVTLNNASANLTLSGANTYTGATTVTAGVLTIASGGSLAAGSAVGVSGGTIGGTGTIGGAVTLSGTGRLNLADGAIGNLTLGSTLAITGAAAGANNLNFDLASSGSTTDKLIVGGATSVTTAGAAVINLNQLGGAATPIAAGTYTLIQGTTSMAAVGQFALATSKAFGQTFTLGVSGNNLQVTTAAGTAGPAAVWWKGGATPWSTAANWNTDAASSVAAGAAPGYQTNVNFYTTTPAAATLTTNTIDVDFDINSLNFASTAISSVTIGGTKMLTIEAGTANGNTAGNGITLNTPNSGTPVVTISSKVGLAASQTWTVNSGASLTVSGAITDFGAGNNLTKDGSGTLTLSGTNTNYAGTTTLTAGTLQGQNPASTNVLNAFGIGGITLNGGTLQLRADGTTNTQTIIAGNNMTIGGSAVTVDVNRRQGTNTGSNITFGNLSIGTGQLNVTGGNSYTLRFAGTTTLTGNATLNATTAGLTLVGNIGDGGNNFGITKTGAGTLTLAGTNTYTGATSVLAGTLVLSMNAPSGVAGVLGNATSTVLVGDTSGSANTTLNIAGDFTVGRNIVVQGGNTGVVTIGSTSASVNSSIISGDIALGSGGFAHDAVFNSGDFHLMQYTGTISGTGGITTIAGSSTSRIIINGNNTFSGGTTISTGVVRIGNNNALGTGTITFNGGTLGTQTAGITMANNQIWAANFGGGIGLAGGGQTLTTTGTNTISGGSRTIGANNVGLNINGTITDGANSYGLAFQNASSDGGNAAISLGGANTFDGGLTIIGAPATRTLTVTTSTSTAAGSGQATLTNAAGSILRLAGALSVDSLNSGIATPVITPGTGGTNGTQALVFTGGGGTGAAGTATISNGVVTGVTITSYGQNYTSVPTISVNNGGTNTVDSSFGSSSVNLQANTLTLSGTNASPATYSGIISGTGNLIKTGSGTQILTGVNSYTGTTTVSGGVLNISGAGALTTFTNGVTVNGGDFSYNSSTALFKTIALSSGIVSGTGNLSGAITMSGGVLSNSGIMGGGVTVNGGLVTSIGTAGAVTLNAGGGINPANTGVAGTFTADSFIWNSDNSISGLRFDLGANTAASDRINLTNAFTKGTGSTFIFDLGDLGYTHSLTYTLVTFDSTDFSVGDFSATGIDGTFILNGNDLSFMTAAAVPEPATYAAILGALALVGVAYRRRRSRGV